MPLMPRWPTAPTPARDVAARAVWDLPGAAPAPTRPAAGPQAAAAPGIVVERLDPVEAARHRDAWLDLLDRALEPNVFLDPDFTLPAAQHLGAVRRPRLLFVWSDAARGPADLLAVCAVLDRAGPARPLAASWLHDLATLGTPLLDRRRADAALRALLLWAGHGLPGARGLVFRALPAEGPTAAALRAAAAGAGHPLATLDTAERAVLRRGSPRAGLAALSRPRAPRNSAASAAASPSAAR